MITQSQPKNEVAEEDGHPLYLAVVKGKSGHVLELVEEELKKGTEPSEIIDKYLIAAINYVGELFEQKKYFLPQLIASAETMEKAINRLEPLWRRQEGMKNWQLSCGNRKGRYSRYWEKSGGTDAEKLWVSCH